MVCFFSPVESQKDFHIKRLAELGLLITSTTPPPPTTTTTSQRPTWPSILRHPTVSGLLVPSSWAAARRNFLTNQEINYKTSPHLISVPILLSLPKFSGRRSIRQRCLRARRITWSLRIPCRKRWSSTGTRRRRKTRMMRQLITAPSSHYRTFRRDLRWRRPWSRQPLFVRQRHSRRRPLSPLLQCQ